MKTRFLAVVLALAAVSAQAAQVQIPEKGRQTFTSMFLTAAPAAGSMGWAGSAADPFTCAAATERATYYNTTSHVVKVCDGTSWKTAPIAAQAITFSGLSAARTITFADASDTVAELGQAQTFTGVNTFSAAIVQNGSLQGNFATFNLTSGAGAATFVKVAIPSNSGANLLVEYVFEASTATPHVQSFGGMIGVNAVNVGGTITCVMAVPTTATQPALATDSGTLTNAITCADAGSGVLNILATDTSSITPTTNRIRYRVRALAATTLTITPQ